MHTCKLEDIGDCTIIYDFSPHGLKDTVLVADGKDCRAIFDYFKSTGLSFEDLPEGNSINERIMTEIMKDFKFESLSSFCGTIASKLGLKDIEFRHNKKRDKKSNVEATPVVIVQSDIESGQYIAPQNDFDDTNPVEKSNAEVNVKRTGGMGNTEGECVVEKEVVREVIREVAIDGKEWEQSKRKLNSSVKGIDLEEDSTEDIEQKILAEEDDDEGEVEEVSEKVRELRTVEYTEPVKVSTSVQMEPTSVKMSAPIEVEPTSVKMSAPIQVEPIQMPISMPSAVPIKVESVDPESINEIKSGLTGIKNTLEDFNPESIENIKTDLERVNSKLEGLKDFANSISENTKGDILENIMDCSKGQRIDLGSVKKTVENLEQYVENISEELCNLPLSQDATAKRYALDIEKKLESIQDNLPSENNIVEGVTESVRSEVSHLKGLNTDNVEKLLASVETLSNKIDNLSSSDRERLSEEELQDKIRLYYNVLGKLQGDLVAKTLKKVIIRATREGNDNILELLNMFFEEV